MWYVPRGVPCDVARDVGVGVVSTSTSTSIIAVDNMFATDVSKRFGRSGEDPDVINRVHPSEALAAAKPPPAEAPSARLG